MAYFAYWLRDCEARGLLVPRVDTYQLIGDITMILPRKFFTDRTLHQTRQRRQDVDRRIYLTIVELPVDKDLSFRDVSGKIRNRVSDICKNQ